ncbi:hypothetical protein [Actinobaculum massiliense]|uniref:hypothetical protein n=1 Tax=Actinobaculum massiliense TaxID=202789 RepID=UPI0002E376F4|nr:hypothetical protein [Actinobaculum massiliense]MDK8319812.1 hypothetical protein [Actinobaculum massiliense]MDK8567075.1 hypothetical protein [Actinobaculum massiliense]
MAYFLLVGVIAAEASLPRLCPTVQIVGQIREYKTGTGLASVFEHQFKFAIIADEHTFFA